MLFSFPKMYSIDQSMKPKRKFWRLMMGSMRFDKEVRSVLCKHEMQAWCSHCVVSKLGSHFYVKWHASLLIPAFSLLGNGFVARVHWAESQDGPRVQLARLVWQHMFNFCQAQQRVIRSASPLFTTSFRRNKPPASYCVPLDFFTFLL